MTTPSFPAWSALLLAFSAGLLVIAFSGVLLGWRRLRARPRRVRSRVARDARRPEQPRQMILCNDDGAADSNDYISLSRVGTDVE